MSASIDFYFDFSSPYSYIAAHQIEALAARHGRAVNWNPILLGAIFKSTGSAPLVEFPLKGQYAVRDFERSARFAGVELKMPKAFPISTVNSARAVLWVKKNVPQRTGDFVRAVATAYFAQDRAINDVAVLQDIANALGLDGAAVAAGTQEAEIKDALKLMTETALARGVFGAPFIFVDDEPFWGQDRLAQVDRWLEQGSF